MRDHTGSQPEHKSSATTSLARTEVVDAVQWLDVIERELTEATLTSCKAAAPMEVI